MNAIEVIKKRKSIRQFKPDMPPRKLILECLEAASWAPNPTSQQPWKFIVLTGKTLQKVSRVIKENFSAANAKKSGVPEPVITKEHEELLAKRKQQTFADMMAFLKSSGVDMQAIGEGNFIFHGAPVGIIFAVYPCKDQNYLKSVVAAMENFMLAATAKGLGTCWMNAVSICQESIKEKLRLSPDLILVDGIAVGYPVPEAPLNEIPRSRLPVEQVTDWRE